MKDEFSLIQDLLADRPATWGKIEVDVGDDAAVVSPSTGRSTVITCDTMVERIHFLPNTMLPEDIGWKLLAANISDVAAMGGKPLYGLLSLAVPGHWDLTDLKGIYRGIYELASLYTVTLLGGDTVRSPQSLVLTLTLIGEVEQGKALTRSSARPGDVVFITGPIGDAAAGLHLLLHEQKRIEQYPKLVKAHRRPLPQVEAGQWLLASALQPSCDDVSDGLVQEAWEIASSSNVRIVLSKEKIPITAELRAYAADTGIDPWDWVLYGGEDFQLLGTAPSALLSRLKRENLPEGVSLYAIGRVEAGDPGVLWESAGQIKPLPIRGYNHFIDR